MSNVNEDRYKANFLWPYELGSVEEAGYEFANAYTEAGRESWWKLLLARAIKAKKEVTHE